MKTIADTVYIEPLTVEFVKQNYSKRKTSAFYQHLGGQTGLNLAVELDETGILENVMLNFRNILRSD